MTKKTITVKSKEAFRKYALNLLKEELRNILAEDEKAEKVKVGGDKALELKKKLYKGDPETSEEATEKEKKAKKSDTRVELEDPSAVWTDVGFQRRKPNELPTDKPELPADAAKFRKDPNKFPKSVSGAQGEFAPVQIAGGERSKFDTTREPVRTKGKNIPLGKDPEVHFTDTQEDPSELTGGKRLIQGFDRTAVKPSIVRPELGVEDAPEYQEEKEIGQGLTNIQKYERFIGDELLRAGISNTGLRMPVTVTRISDGDVTDTLVEDMTPSEIVALVAKNPQLLKPKYTSLQDFIEKNRNPNFADPVADMYDPEMVSSDFEFELGSSALPPEPKREEEEVEEEEDKLVSAEEIGKLFGLEERAVEYDVETATKKYKSLFNNSFMKKVSEVAMDLGDLTTDFVVEYDDQLRSDDDAQYALAFDQFLDLLIKNGYAGSYFDEVMSIGSGGKMGSGKKMPEQSKIKFYKNLGSEASAARAAIEKMKPNTTLDRGTMNQLLLLQLAAEEKNGVMDLFEKATELSLDENMDEETLREEIINYLEQYSTNLYSMKGKMAQAAGEKLGLNKDQNVKGKAISKKPKTQSVPKRNN
jgi:hypothetical protein